MKPGILTGIRVLDLSRVLAGPWACQILADMGAEVTKVERPGEGDGSRVFGPPFLKTTDGREVNQTAIYLAANRNKKSIAIDIARKEGQELVRQLAARSDVLVENYKVGDLARYGLDYDAIRAVNPGIVYCSITGFGQTGPYRNRLGYDTVFQAMSGLMESTGPAEGTQGGGPTKAGPSISDLFGGLFAGIAILSALLNRQRNAGQGDAGGEYIDLSLLDCSVAAMTSIAMQYMMTGNVPARLGNGGNGGVPADIFECQGGSIYMISGNDQQYYRMCEALKRPDLAQDERYRLQRSRIERRHEIVEVFRQVLRPLPIREVLDAFEKAGVPAAPIYNQKEVFDDPHIRERGMRVEIPHPDAGTLSLVANPIRFREHPITKYTPPPDIGEHTGEILSSQLGLDRAAIEGLIAASVVAARPPRQAG